MKNKKVIIGVISLIILVLIGVGVYFLFIKKENKSNVSKESYYSEKINSNIYQTQDGKKTFKIFNTDNEEMNNKARSIIKDLKDADGGDASDIEEDYFIKNDRYLGEYNGTLVVIENYHNSIDSRVNGQGKYTIYVADRIGEFSQCGNYTFVVDDQTKKLINFDYENKYYEIVTVGNNNYIREGNSCFFENDNLRDESLNKVADGLVYIDSFGSGDVFYALKDNYLTEFSSDGKVIKKGNIKIDNKSILGKLVANMDGKAYALLQVDGLIYLYDFNGDTKYKIYNGSLSRVCRYNEDDYSNTSAALSSIDVNKLRIILYPKDEDDAAFPWTYLFDISSKKLEHIGYYLMEDAANDNPYFYVFNADNKEDYYVYKYSNDGKVISKAKYDPNYDYEEFLGGTFAYNGKFFALTWDDNKYYLEESFNNNKKYEILDKNSYDLVAIDYDYPDDQINGKITFTATDKNTGDRVKYCFEMGSGKISKINN